MILSMIVRAGVKSTDVLCLQNITIYLFIFVIFSKRGYLDIVPLCCKASQCVQLLTLVVSGNQCISCCRSRQTAMITVTPVRVDFPRASDLRWSVCKLTVANRERKDVTVSKT